MPSHARRRKSPSRFYRTVAAGFSALVLFLAATTLVFAFSRAEVVIVPASEEKEWTTTIVVSPDRTDAPDAIPGTITSKSITLEGSSPVEGGKIIEDHARGTVTVINNYSRSQPLVATTRFLSKNNILFRSTRSITVPAGGRVNVEVRADQPGKGGEIGSSHFTIPGLWPGIQDKIFAESDAAMVGGERRITLISDADNEKARASLAALHTSTLHEFNNSPEYTRAVLSLEKTSEQILTPAGSESDAARIRGTFKLIAVTYDADALQALIAKQIPLQFPLAQLPPSRAPKLSIENAGDANTLLNVRQTVTTMTRADELRIDGHMLKGKKINEAKRILTALPGVGEVTITLSPRFLTRLPRLTDHITITLQTPSPS